MRAARINSLLASAPRCSLATRARTIHTSSAARAPKSLLTLADLSTGELDGLVRRAAEFKRTLKSGQSSVHPSLSGKSIGILFTKRSTRTRIASETSVATLGGHPMFLSPSDIQLGVNESLYDTVRVVSSMVDGIMARVGAHDEIETFAENSQVPVVNALSSRYHPTQILADMLTMLEVEQGTSSQVPSLSSLAGRKVAWVGDSNNILNDMLVAYPRLGIHLSVATPPGAPYERDPVVWETMEKGLAASAGEHGSVQWTNDPAAAVRDADYIVTDTWISMGDEASKEQRLRDFAGFQVTEALAQRGGAKPDWKFLHCLPRKAQEVDDEVFYGPRSIVFPEAENRKWTIMACFDWLFGHRELRGN